MNYNEILNKLSESLMNYVETTCEKYQKKEASSYELTTMVEASNILVEIAKTKINYPN